MSTERKGTGRSSEFSDHLDDSKWDRKFWEAHSMLPPNFLQKESYAMPAADTESAGAGASIVREFGDYRVTAVASSSSGMAWDLPSAKSEILVVCGGVLVPDNVTNAGIYLLTTTGPADGYAFICEANASRWDFLKAVGGVFGDIGNTGATWDPNLGNGARENLMVGMAFYYNSPILRGFVRYNGATWTKVLEVSDATYSSIESIAQLSAFGANNIFRFTAPLVIAHN